MGAALIAGLFLTRAWVRVGPPLSFRGARILFSDAGGTISVALGVKPDAPASPLLPNILKSWLKILPELTLLISDPSSELLPEIMLLRTIKFPWLSIPPPLSLAVFPDIVLLVTDS